MTDEPNIMIAVSTHQHSIHPRCMTSIIDAGQMLSLAKARYQIGTIDKSGSMALVCDMYASLIVQNETFSHILFLDGDLRFGRSAVLRLLQSGKPMIGLACPQRQIAPRFSVTFLKKEARVAKGVVEVESIGMGATLVHRSVFETMIQKAVVFSSKAAPATIPALTGPLYNFFHPICTKERRLSEEASFCMRWRAQCLGQIHALIDEEVGQYGNHEFKGRLADHLTFKDQAEEKAQTSRK